MSSNTRNNTSTCSRTTRLMTRQQAESEAQEARLSRSQNRLPLASLSLNIRARFAGPNHQENVSRIRIRVPDSLSPEPEPHTHASNTSSGESVRRGSARESHQTNAAGSSRGVYKGKRSREDYSGSVESSSSSPFNKKSRLLKGQDCKCANEFKLVLHYLRGAYSRIDSLDEVIFEQGKTINVLSMRLQELEAKHASGSSPLTKNKGKAKSRE
ncbi:hypothetical protein BCR41DRAFT_144532 [Lobosporangium transversale]|uniref:Uncharacterized protein n=1 Tax=Lobosporangium transversale TaxID=64571 RepID=A0A1Y2GE79_9FUNG|nr:hypothetical protein BCR41DRAFT_144532 [Lobosporangium transversale]ORZ08455.1 hypothetical protein BCR41DRAFT_144532 [Lobosporangium transversale]|eukprot:XP_021878383.1 hypothetical protein BCR41DRAFT_144532 [Lobosporangium transversale]